MDSAKKTNLLGRVLIEQEAAWENALARQAAILSDWAKSLQVGSQFASDIARDMTEWVKPFATPPAFLAEIKRMLRKASENPIILAIEAINHDSFTDGEVEQRIRKLAGYIWPDFEKSQYALLMMTAAIIALGELIGPGPVRFKMERNGKVYIDQIMEALDLESLEIKLRQWANARLAGLLREAANPRYTLACQEKGDRLPSQDLMDRWRIATKPRKRSAKSNDSAYLDAAPDGLKIHGRQLYIQNDDGSRSAGEYPIVTKEKEKHYPPHIKFPNPAEKYHAKRLNEQRREFIENISTRNPFFTITEAATIRAAWTIIRREPGVSAEELNRQLAELSGASLDAVHKRLERIRSKGQIPMIREALDYALPKFRKMEVSKLKSRRPACVRCEKSPMVIWSCSRCSIDPARISKPISYSSGLCSKHEAEPEKYHREFCPACGWPRGMQYVTGCPICTPGAGFNPGELSKILKKNEKSCRV